MMTKNKEEYAFEFRDRETNKKLFEVYGKSILKAEKLFEETQKVKYDAKKYKTLAWKPDEIKYRKEEK